MKNLLIVLFTFFFVNQVIAEVKIGFVQVDQILQNAPQTNASNKKLEKEFKKRTDTLKKNNQGNTDRRKKLLKK